MVMARRTASKEVEAHEGVAGTDVEIDVGQRLYLVVAFQLGYQLEKQAQLADFHRLFHDVNAVEVVQDYGLEDEVPLAGVTIRLVQYPPKVLKMVGTALALGPFGIVQETQHPFHAGGVQRFKYVESSEEKSPDPQVGSSTEIPVLLRSLFP